MNNKNWMNILWLMLPSKCSRIQTTVCFRDNKRSRNPNCSNLPLRFILDYSKLCTSNTLTWTFNLCKLSWLCNKKKMKKKNVSIWQNLQVLRSLEDSACKVTRRCANELYFKAASVCRSFFHVFPHFHLFSVRHWKPRKSEGCVRIPL